jgi:hypothetical protein
VFTIDNDFNIKENNKSFNTDRITFSLFVASTASRFFSSVDVNAVGNNVPQFIQSRETIRHTKRKSVQLCSFERAFGRKITVNKCGLNLMRLWKIAA